MFYRMQIFDEIRSRGVEEIFFISMDGVSGLESGAKAIFRKSLYKDASSIWSEIRSDMYQQKIIRNSRKAWKKYMD